MSLNKILIVEDEYLIADDVARAFLTIGCLGIEMAADVSDALCAIQRGSPDGAVLDLNLRSEMVFPVADVLLQQQIPFVFMTGHDPSAIPQRFQSITRCQKPIAPIHVAKALLRTARDRSRATQSLASGLNQ